ncbi:hypothetical protein Cpir12675_003367 [Ceratocystis pirilliformis]|uniref:Zn(2)-C6 fungal-type domain-containing protein n=1 Tax=Ceratocystis pirilliformis TaxID=259994 RepID=A0ABR3Z5Q7_9PEZI
MAAPRPVQHPLQPEPTKSSTNMSPNPVPVPGLAPAGPEAYLPAPYGKACAECVKTKRKCMLPASSGECQRCHRLHKVCHRPPTTGVRKRATGSRALSRAALEEKLDNLVNLLQQKSGGQSAAPQPATSSAAVSAAVAIVDVSSTPGSSVSALSPGRIGVGADDTGSASNDAACLTAPSSNRATLQDLAEVSASASSTVLLARQPDLTQSSLKPAQQARQQQQRNQKPPLPPLPQPYPLQQQQQQQPHQQPQQQQHPKPSSNAPQPLHHTRNTHLVPLQPPAQQTSTQPPLQHDSTQPQQSSMYPYSILSVSSLGSQMPSTASKPPPTTKRAVMPNIFNPAREFINNYIQGDILHHKSSATETPSWVPQEFTPQEEEAMFNRFRTENMKYFPFVYIPSNTSASCVKNERPFLWLAIVNVTSKITSVQTRMSKLIREVISQLIMTDQSATLDVLQGLVVFLGWGNHQMSNDLKPFMCMYINITMGILSVININKTQNEYLASQDPNPPPSFSDREMDEKRAALGCYFISSSLSYFLHIGSSIPSMPWMPYMEDYLLEIALKQDSPYDNILVIMTRCQLVTMEATKLFREINDRNDSKIGSTIITQTMQCKMLQSRISEIKEMISPEIRDNYIVQSVVNTAEIAIHDVSCWDIPPSEPWVNTERVNILGHCFHLLRDWFDSFFGVPVKTYMSLPFNVWFQIFRNCCILCKLTTIDQKGWDRAYVRQTLDVIAVIERISNNFTSAASESGIVVDTSPGDDVFSRSRRPLFHMRSAWESHLIKITGTAFTGTFGAGIGAITPADSTLDNNGQVAGAPSMVMSSFTANTQATTTTTNGSVPQPLGEAISLDFGIDFDWFSDIYSYGRI